MEKCKTKGLRYNNVTRRCYKTCHQKNKDTHPVTKKCRQKCNTGKIRRVSDFRCVSLKKEKLVSNNISNKPVLSNKMEELVPAPLQTKFNKNFQFLKDLLDKSQGRAVHYSGNSLVSDIMTIYFHDKYKQNCPMYPIKSFSEYDTELFKKYYEANKTIASLAYVKKAALKQYKMDYTEWDKAKFFKNLKLCLETGEQLIMVPFRLPMHLNMLIIKVPTREIIRFEPHGNEYKSDAKVNIAVTEFLEKLTKDINSYFKLTNKFTYVDPAKICPRHTKRPDFYVGFQEMDRYGMSEKALASEGGGFCQLWSWFFAECVINNPEMAVKEVYEAAYDILKTDESHYASIIRGYFFSINEELLKMNKAFSVEKNYIDSHIGSDLLLDYLNKSRAKLKTKAKKTFVGGVNKKPRFILPPLNPKAAPVHL
jgi:hypothetical protein